MSVAVITKLMAIISIVLTVGIIMIAILRARKLKKSGVKWKTGKKVGVAITSLLLVILVVANGAVYMLNNIINQHFSAVKVDDVAVEDATTASKDMTTLLEEEGIVLLENKESALPLNVKDNNKVNVFGIGSQKLVYGGAGSGASDESENVTLQQGLEAAGFEVNKDLVDFYTEHLPSKSKTNIFNLKGGDYNIYEPAASEYSDSLISQAKSYSDTAVVVLSRSGGEGGDLPMDMSEYKNGDAGRNYLELQSIEEDMLQIVEENFDRVVVVINSSNAMELSFLEDEAIDAAIWIGGPGATGCTAVGEVLAGTVNPSGKLVDTYAYDLTSAPAYYNAGDFTYTDGGENTSYKYVDYQEGIYVGYRYYETRFVNNQTGECDESAYAEAVQYPFGYGLSYTEFTQELVSHHEKDGKITAEVKVTNNGTVAGKDVVQLYETAPYTEGGIEKAHVVLQAFGKTGMLEPGSSETVTLEFSVEDMASYDYQQLVAAKGGYVLEAGDYQIKLMKNSHEVIDSFTYTVKATVVYEGDKSRSTDAVVAENLFDNAAGDITYVSRNDWEGTLPTERVETREATKAILEEMNADNINKLYCSDDPEADSITTGAKNGLTLEDMVGVAYDDKKWEDLLDEMSIDEMGKLIGFGGFSTIAIDSIDKAATIDIDGPAGLNALTSDISGVQFPSEVVIASTFNTELASEMGSVYAQEANAHGVNGLYASAVNIHRTPFSGRNFEYYSEDPVLSGKIGASVAKGITGCGIITYVKHFALNDQETNRSGIAVWSNEQGIREIYLKAFEIVVKEGNATGIMSSYNRIGTVWAGGNTSLITGVLRNEWNFHGVVITDYDNGGYMNSDQVVRAGGDLMLSTLGHVPAAVTTDSDYGKQQMRSACKNILYSTVNSRAYTDPVTMGFPYWLLIGGIVDAVLYLILSFVLIKITKKPTITIIE